MSTPLKNAVPDPEKLSHETLRTYFDEPGQYSHKLGDDDFQMVVDSVENRIQLVTSADGSATDSPSRLRSLTWDHDEDSGTYVLTMEGGELPEAAYSLAYAVYQGMSLGKTFHNAVNSAVDSFKELLAASLRMSEEQVAGLFGELLLLDHLMDELGVAAALNSWLGPSGEEHDFGLENLDLEVKTTLSERRNHVINGMNQLLPRQDRTLWLVSIQLTRAGSGRGRSLDDVCRSLLSRARGHAHTLRRILLDYGWREEDTGMYPTRFTHRSVPRAYLVDQSFPALTEPRITRDVPSIELITNVNYRVDVAGLPHGLPAEILATFVEGVQA